MLFNSSQFLVFFPIVVFLYYAIPKKWRYLWLFGASYYFYMCWNVKYVFLLFASTLVTYISGLLLERAERSSKPNQEKKWIVAGSFIINLCILIYFKYVGFSLHVVIKILSIFQIQWAASRIDILLPVGISFYTFQALSYTMDVYRGDVYAEKNFFRYALFVSFFPQLVAGPIERSKTLLKQLAVPKPFSYEKARDGLFLMVWGYFLKLVLADRIAIFVDTVYGDYLSFNGWYIITATVLFAVQIYCDFAGYSTIAMGAAEILGISLMENFDAPYLSVTVSNFWRRWHISLTSWFKDYLYIPLGGSRKGKTRKYLNKMIVFLVSGLWHGADLSFVFWGGINGIYQIAGEILQPIRDKLISILHIDRHSIMHLALKGITTFVLIDFSWIFFRANSYRTAISVIKSMFSQNNVWIFMDGSIYNCGLDEKNFRVMVFSVIVLLFADIMKRRTIALQCGLQWIKATNTMQRSSRNVAHGDN